MNQIVMDEFLELNTILQHLKGVDRLWAEKRLDQELHYNSQVL